MGMIIGFVLLLVAAPALAQDRTRVDLYDAKSGREGYAIIERDTGRIGMYDKNSRRTGYGVIRPDGRVDRYRLDGTRAGSADALKPKIRR